MVPKNTSLIMFIIPSREKFMFKWNINMKPCPRAGISDSINDYLRTFLIDLPQRRIQVWKIHLPGRPVAKQQPSMFPSKYRGFEHNLQERHTHFSKCTHTNDRLISLLSETLFYHFTLKYFYEQLNDIFCWYLLENLSFLHFF